jgi:hypothetical protein
LGIDSSPFSMPPLYLRNAFFLSRKPGPLQTTVDSSRTNRGIPVIVITAVVYQRHQCNR